LSFVIPSRFAIRGSSFPDNRRFLNLVGVLLQLISENPRKIDIV